MNENIENDVMSGSIEYLLRDRERFDVGEWEWLLTPEYLVLVLDEPITDHSTIDAFNSAFAT